MSKSEQVDDVSHYLRQVYVIHKNGIVIAERKYGQSCIDINPQLIGGFLGSMIAFIQDITRNEYCSTDVNMEHKLNDIGMTCSRWFVDVQVDFIIALLVENDSPLITNSKFNIIEDLASKILIAFIIFNDFSNKENNPKFLQDFSDEFGQTIDNLLAETISEEFNRIVDFSRTPYNREHKNGEDIHE